MAGPGPRRFVKHGVIHCDSILCVGARDHDEVDKVREVVEQGLNKTVVVVSK